MTSPLVSIVVTAYQSDPQELSEALESALGQSLTDIEIIISDDSASDRVREVADSFQDARIRYRANPYRLGVAANHAIAFAESRGKYIAILNHDDRWETNFLAVLVPPLERQSHVVLSFCDHYLINQQGTILTEQTELNSQRWGRADLTQGIYQPFEELLVKQSIPIAVGTVFRRAALQRKFPLEAGSAYDLWLAYLLCSTLGGCYYTPERLSCWRIHAGQLTSLGGLDGYWGTALCWSAVVQDARLRKIQGQARRKAAEAYTVCAINLWRENKRLQAISSAGTAAGYEPSWKRISLCFLPLIPWSVIARLRQHQS